MAYPAKDPTGTFEKISDGAAKYITPKYKSPNDVSIWSGKSLPEEKNLPYDR